jgi:hypothetical protein
MYTPDGARDQLFLASVARAFKCHTSVRMLHALMAQVGLRWLPSSPGNYSFGTTNSKMEQLFLIADGGLEQALVRQLARLSCKAICITYPNADFTVFNYSSFYNVIFDVQNKHFS